MKDGFRVNVSSVHLAIIVILMLMAFGLVNTSVKGISLTPSEKQTCKDLDISKSDCEKVVQERAQQGAQYNSTEGAGIQQAQTAYENKFFSVKTPPSGFGAPQSGDVNLTWTFSPGPAIDIHSPYTQGYYKFYGINENYTKTHNISGVIIVISKSNLLLNQFDSDPVISVNGEQLTFTNGTKTTVPAESIDLRYGVQLK